MGRLPCTVKIFDDDDSTAQPGFLSTSSISSVNTLRLSDVIALPTLLPDCSAEIFPADENRSEEMSRNTLSGLLAAPLVLLASFCLVNPAATATPTAAAETAAVLQTKMAQRDLWVEHVFWIRSYVLATHAGDESQSKVAEAEVVTNAKALASTIKPFYGQAASDSLLKLLAGHWTAVRDYNTALVNHSHPARDKAAQAITANAHEIAKFLSGANPYLPEDAVFGLLAAHGAHHMAQSNQVAANDFRSEAQTWHGMRRHMLTIADSIAGALAKQFPDRF